MAHKDLPEGRLYRPGILKFSPAGFFTVLLLGLSASSLMLFNDNYKTYVVFILGAASGLFLYHMGKRLDGFPDPPFDAGGFLKKTAAVHALLIPLSLNFLCRRFHLSSPALPYKMAVLNRTVVAVFITALFFMIIRPFLNRRFFARIDGLTILTGVLGTGILSYPPLSAMAFFDYKPEIFINSIACLLIANLFLSFAAVFLSIDVRPIMEFREKKGNGLKVAASFILVFFSVAAVMDNIYLYYSGRHFDAELWGYVFDRHVIQNVRIYSNYFTMSMVTAFAGAVALYVVCFLKTVRRNAGRKEAADALSSAVFAGYAGTALLSAMFIVSPYPRNSSQYETWNMVTTPPPVSLITSFADFASVDRLRRTVKIPALSDELENKLIRSGIPYASEDPRFPFYKESIHDGSPEKNVNKPFLPGNTNLVIVMAESFTQWFLSDEARKKYIKDREDLELAPCIEAMAARGIVFEKMLSPVRGTKLGHIAILGSWFETNRRTSENVGDQGQDYLFLSEILADRGYRCLHIQGTSSEFNSEKDMFTKHGFREFYSYESSELGAVSERLPSEDKGLTAWGYSDDVVFRFAVEKLKTMDRKKPFLLTVATMDTHTPYNGGDLLDGVHTTDRAFGYLMDYIGKSDLGRNTAVLFVADHAPRSESDYLHLRNYFSGGDIPTDWITAIMKLPGNPEWTNKKIDTVCSQTDITPTLLDMMGIDTPNPFIGLSVFSDRPAHPVLVGLHTMTYDKGVSCLSVYGKDRKKLSALLEWVTYHKRVIEGKHRNTTPLSMKIKPRKSKQFTKIKVYRKRIRPPL
jgi:arylsulfatase A-like enzyme